MNYSSDFWLQYVTQSLKEFRPCTDHFLIARNLYRTFKQEIGSTTDTPIIRFQGFEYQWMDYPGERNQPQHFDTIYAACSSYETITENNRIYKTAPCTSMNRPLIGLHMFIVPPPILSSAQGEIYRTLRLDGTPPDLSVDIALVL